MGRESAFLIEASWEVCNKVGGIYTVVSSKLGVVLKQFPNHYLAVGPYLSANNPVFVESKAPADLEQIAQVLEIKGVILHYGTWKTGAYDAPVILLDWNGLIPQLNSFKGHFWDQYQLDTLGSNFYDLDQPLLWGIAVGLFCELFAEAHPEQIILQAHEWLSAGALLQINKNKRFKTVFTTHATVLGRALSSHGVAVYQYPKDGNPEQDARNYGVLSKHQVERLAAGLATHFTTVSRLTAEEATVFLGRTPDQVTENGIDLDSLPTYDQVALAHLTSRTALDDFVSAYFFPSYSFDLQQVQYQFTMGRYEVHNKGYDLYLEALGKLNQELKEQKSERTVVSFLLVPGSPTKIRSSVTGQLMIYRRIQELLRQFSQAKQRGLYGQLIANPADDTAFHLEPKELEQLHPLITRLVQPTQPFLSPYELVDETNDSFLSLAHQYGLQNSEEDRVKIVLMPVYLDGFDGIFNLSLYTFIAGFDLGVFPSYYEPWGYTPMESLAMGVPAIASTLSGFGRAIQEGKGSQPPGVFLVDRRQAEEDALGLLLAQLHTSLRETPQQWDERRLSAYQTVRRFNWQHLYPAYQQLYNQP